MTPTDWQTYQHGLRQDIAEAVTLPFRAYTDSDILAVERDRIFFDDWVFVCAEQQLPQHGDYYVVDLAGESIAVLRGQDGQVRALSNVCRHRGTPLLDPGFGRLNRHIVCPYHAWTYDDMGKLRGIPHSGNFDIDKTAHCLPELKLESWHGLLFVNLGDSQESLAERLEGLDDYLQAFELNRFSVGYANDSELWNANWKLVVENGIESYHLFKVHRDTLETITPTQDAFYVAGSSEWAVTAGRMKAERSALSRWLVGEVPEALHHYLLIFLPPSFVGILTYDSLDWISVLPEGVDRSRISSGGISTTAPHSGDAPASDFTKAFFAEDKPSQIELTDPISISIFGRDVIRISQ